MAICASCGEVYNSKRAFLGHKDCINCALQNDSKIRESMAKRIVPACHKGNLTYAGSKENILHMMKK